jgi:putative transposase
VEIWAYCLMPNHVHLIAVPRIDEGLARAIGEAHRRYANYINARSGFRGPAPSKKKSARRPRSP